MSTNSSGLSPQRHAHALSAHGLADHAIVRKPSPTQDTQLTRAAYTALWKPDRARFLQLHKTAIESHVGFYDMEKFLTSFQEDAERKAWFDSFETEKGFSHVIGDLFAKESRYEGWLSFEAFRTLCSMISCYKEKLSFAEQKPFDIILKKVKASTGLVDLRKFGTKHCCALLAQAIRKLSLHESILIPTGYERSDEAHATLLEVIKTNDDPARYSVHSYNTGEGADIVGIMIKDVVKKRVRRMSFKEIPEEVLLTGPDGGSWLQALLEPNTPFRNRAHNQEYNMEFVHRVVFPVLAPYFNHENRSEFFTAQTSGTCAWRSLIAWLHFQLDETAYKPFVTWQKSHILLLGYSKWLKESYAEEQDSPAVSAQVQTLDELLRLVEKSSKAPDKYSLTPESGQKIEDYMRMSSSHIRLLELAANELLKHIQGRFLKHVPKGASIDDIAPEYKTSFIIAHTVKNFVHRFYEAVALKSHDLNQVSFALPKPSSVEGAIKIQKSQPHPDLTPYTHTSGPLKLELPLSISPDPVEAITNAVLVSRSQAYNPHQATMALCRFVIETMPSLNTCRTWPVTLELLTQVQALNGSIVGYSLQISNGRLDSPWALAASGKLLSFIHHMACKLSDEDLRPRHTDSSFYRDSGGKGLLADQKFKNFPRLFFQNRYALVLDPTLKASFEEAALYWDQYGPQIDFETNFEGSIAGNFEPNCQIDLSSNTREAQPRFWYNWISSLKVDKQAAVITAEQSTADVVLELMKGKLPPTHPAYAILLLRQAISATHCLHDFAVQDVNNLQSNKFITDPARALAFLVSKSLSFSRGEYDYHIGTEVARVSIGIIPTIDAQVRSRNLFWPLSQAASKMVESTGANEFARHLKHHEETPIISNPVTPETYLTLALRRGQAEPLQNPSLLLYYLSERMSKLDDSDLRGLFFLSFFKSKLTYSEGFESSITKALSSASFTQRLKAFLKEGFTHYIDRQPGGEPSHEPAIFLSIVSLCCRYIAYQSHEKSDVLWDLCPQAQRYLDEKIKDEAPIHIRFQAHMAQLLSALLTAPKTEESCKKLLIHWMKYNSLKGKTPQEHQIKWFQHLVSSEFYQALPEITASINTCENLQSIAQSLFKDQISPAYRSALWQSLGAETSAFKASLPDTSSYLIMDFAKGVLANEMGVLLSGAKPSWFEDAIFKAFFGNEKPIYVLAGQYCLITHKKVEFRALVNASYWSTSFQIKDQETGKWLYYARTGIGGFPETFNTRYWFFFDSDTNQFYGYSRDTLTRVATVSLEMGAVVGNHRIFKVKNKRDDWLEKKAEEDFLGMFSGWEIPETESKPESSWDDMFEPTDGGARLTEGAEPVDAAVITNTFSQSTPAESLPAPPLSTTDATAAVYGDTLSDDDVTFEQSPTPDDLILQIESTNYVELEETFSSEGDFEPKRSLFLPRFQSWGGDKLRFNESAGKWYYAHSQYYVDISKDQPRLLGKINQYVSLINDEGERLVLLPVCEWKSNKPGLGSDFIANITNPPSGNLALLDGTIHFLEYHVSSNGKLNSGSLEALVYISMIWYLQKQFLKAFEEINSLPAKDLKSKAVREAFSQFISHAQANPDFGPESVACLVRFFNKTHLVLNEIFLENPAGGALILEWVLDVYSHYIKTFDRLSTTMRLSGEDELELARFFSDKNKDSAVVQSRIEILEKASSFSSWNTQLRALTAEPLLETFTPEKPKDYALSFSAQVLPDETPELTKTYELTSLIDTKSAKLMLGLKGADKTTLDYYKVFLQTQTSIEKTNTAFLTLFAILIACEEHRDDPSWPVSRDEYELIYNYINVFAKTSIGEAFFTRNTPAYHGGVGSYYGGSQFYSGNISDAQYITIQAFYDRFHSEIIPAAFQKTKEFLPRRLRLQVNELQAFETTSSVHAAHKIDWYHPSDLRTCLSDVAFPSPSFSTTDLRALFNLNPFNALRLDFKRSCAIAAKESETMAMEEENRLYLEDLRAAQAVIEARSRVSLNSKAFTAFFLEAHAKMQALQAESKALETAICDCLNKLPEEDAPSLLAELASRDQGSKPVYEMKEAVFLFLKGQKAAFLESNPLLSDSEIESLMKQISLWLMLQTDLQHLQRIETLQIEHEKHKENPSEAYYAEMLKSTCESHREYDPCRQPELLVFEYLSKMRLRAQQVRLIEQMLQGEASYNNCVTQLIMGGGKTSVLATVLLVLAAEKGLALFVTPASQFSTVKENLAQSMKQCFNRELISLEIDRNDLNVKNVAALYRTLNEARLLGKPVIVKPETLQMLELEFITLSNRFAETISAGKSLSSDELDLLDHLATTCSLIKEKGQVLIDEVDLVLDTLKEVNFPGGVVKTISPDRVDMMRHIFAIMVDPALTLKDHLKIDRVLQGEFDVEFFKKEAIAILAKELAARSKSMKLAGFEKAFVRYACGIKSTEIGADDRAFFEYVATLNRSSNIQDVNAAAQIALAKHILQDVLTTTLTKGCGRNFGRTRGDPAGKVIPYQGVDTPSTSEFGYHIEAACYQFQTAIQTGIQSAQITRLAQVFIESATKTAERPPGMAFNETPEAREFLALTGIELSQAKFPDKIQWAAQKLESERKAGFFENILKIEAETVLTSVTFHAYRVSSGPQSFSSMFNSVRAFSGTPWNTETYPLSMKKAYIKDLGTEGQIIATMLDRANRQSLVHSISTADPVEMIHTVMDQYSENPGRVSMLLDPSGLFKGKDNKQIATAVRDYLKKRSDLKFKGVLFFTRPPKGQERSLFKPDPIEGDGFSDIEETLATPDTLAFLPIGSNTIIYIKGTRKEELEKHDLHPGEYFVVDDERHTTGTDIAMTPEAVAVMTMDESLTKPRMCQAVMRLRQYLYTQNLHVVILEETLKKRAITELSMADVVSLSNRAQALQKYQIIERSFSQKIDNLFRSRALSLILKSARSKDPLKIEQVSHALNSFMAYETSDDPYALFGGPDEDVGTLEHLMQKFDDRQRVYLKALAQIGVENTTDWDRKKDSLLREIHECRFLPKKRKKMMAELTGVEQFVEVQAQVQVAEEVNQAILNEQEIMQELLEGQIKALHKATQQKWTEPDAVAFLLQIRNKQSNASEGARIKWQSYAPAFLKHHTSLKSQKRDFLEAFGDNFICTENFQYTAKVPLPLFHAKLRDPNRLLLVQREDGSYAGILLSLEEAQFWQNSIESQKHPCVWLLDPSGTCIGEHEVPAPTNIEAVQLLLVEMNAVLGNVNYLNRNKTATFKWLESSTKPKIEFVKYSLLSRKDPFQRKQFVESEIFNPEEAEKTRMSQATLLAHL